MKLIFLGTKGGMEKSTKKEHKIPTCLIVKDGNDSIGFELNKDCIDKLNSTSSIFISHLHPDHFDADVLDKVRVPIYVPEQEKKRFPKDNKFIRFYKKEKPIKVGNLVVIPYEVVHSLEVRSFGFKIIGSYGVGFFPDLIFIENRDEALKGLSVYIGDGSLVTKDRVRREQDKLYGHSSMLTQVGWCRRAKIPIIIFTHIGEEAMSIPDSKIIEKLESVFKDYKGKIIIPKDGEVIDLTKLLSTNEDYQFAIKVPKIDLNFKELKLLVNENFPNDLIHKKVILILDDIAVAKAFIRDMKEEIDLDEETVILDKDGDRTVYLSILGFIEPMILETKMVGKLISIDSLLVKPLRKLSDSELFKLKAIANLTGNLEALLKIYDEMKRRGLKLIKTSKLDEMLIKSFKNYDPTKLKSEVLRDDWRLLTAYWCNIQRGMKFKVTKEEIEALGVLIMKELIKRGDTVFHPDTMKPCAREFYERVTKIAGKPKEEHSFDLSIITPDYLKKLSDSQLIKLYKQLHEAYKKYGNQASLEDWVNADVFILKEMKDRGIEVPFIDDRVTEIARAIVWEYPNPPLSKLTSDERVFIDDIVSRLKSVVLVDEEPVVYLVGGIVNRGYSDKGHDIDFFVKMKEPDERIEKAIKSMFPEEWRDRIQVIFGDEPPQLGFSLPLYKLTLSRTTLLSENSVDLNTVVKFLKPYNKYGVSVFFNPEELFENWAKPRLAKGIGLFVEEKVDGIRFQIYWDKSKDSLRFITEDRHRDRAGIMDFMLKEFKEKIGKHYDSLILDGEWIEYERCGAKDIMECDKLPREDMIKWVTSKDKMDDTNVIFWVYDILYINGKDVHNLPYKERRKLYEEVVDKRSYHYRPVPSIYVTTAKEFEQAVDKMRRIVGSEGVVAKNENARYLLTGRTKEYAKMKNIKDYDGIVLGKRLIKGTKNTYQYEVGVFLPKNRKSEFDPEHIKTYKGKDYLIIGTTYNTNIQADIGDIIEVGVIRVRRYINERTGKPYLTHMFPVVIRKRTDKDRPDSVAIIEKIEKVRTGVLSDTTIRIPMPLCPYYDNPQVCPIKRNPAYILNMEIWKETLKFPIKCPLASIFKCRYVKTSYYYRWEKVYETEDRNV